MLVALSVAPDKILLNRALVIFVAQMSENHILVPRIMDRSVGVNPIITILRHRGIRGAVWVCGRPVGRAAELQWCMIIAYRAMLSLPASAAAR